MHRIRNICILVSVYVISLSKMEVRSVCSQWIDGGRADASVNDQTQVKVILVFLPRWSNTYVLYHTYSCLAVYVGIE